MQKQDQPKCPLLCFKNCNNTIQQSSLQPNLLPFEKLSLKKIKEEHYHPSIKRTQSYKRIERPIPTTDRSLQAAEGQIATLIDMKRTLEEQLHGLNKDFDRYYEIYNKKIKELKEIQRRMNDQGTVKYL